MAVAAAAARAGADHLRGDDGGRRQALQALQGCDGQPGLVHAQAAASRRHGGGQGGRALTWQVRQQGEDRHVVHAAACRAAHQMEQQVRRKHHPWSSSQRLRALIMAVVTPAGQGCLFTTRALTGLGPRVGHASIELSDTLLKGGECIALRYPGGAAAADATTVAASKGSARSSRARLLPRECSVHEAGLAAAAAAASSVVATSCLATAAGCEFASHASRRGRRRLC